MVETWQRILGKKAAESPGGTVEVQTVEVRVLEAEVKRLRAEREARDAAERELIAELQRRCDRIIELQVNVDEHKSKISTLLKEREEQASYETELMTLIRDVQTLPSEPSKPPVLPVLSGSSGSSTASSTSSGSSSGSPPSAVSVGSLKSRILELEIERSALAESRGKQQEELTSLRVQVNQLKQVIHELGSSGEEKELSVAFEAASGLSKETFTLLDKCPWNEEVMREIKGMEEAYEWETWSVFHDWSGAPQHVVQTLPGLAGGRAEALSLETRTMTSKDGSTLVNLEDVALPGQGWEWVGGWRVDMNSGAADVDGWCYGATAQDLLAGRGGEQGLVAKGKRRVRCRRWVRLRLLVRVDGLCEMAQRFLSLHAKVAAMELLTCKLSEQILRAQGTINDREVQASKTVVLEKQVKALQGKLAQSEKRASDLQQKLAIVQNEERILRACQPNGDKGSGTGFSFSSSMSSSIGDGKEGPTGLGRWFARDSQSQKPVAGGLPTAKKVTEAAVNREKTQSRTTVTGAEAPPTAALFENGASAFNRLFQRDSSLSAIRVSTPPNAEPSSAKQQGNEEQQGSTRTLFPPSLKWFGKGQQQQKAPGSREEMSEEDSEYGGILSSFDEVAQMVGELDRDDCEQQRDEEETLLYGQVYDFEDEDEEISLRGLTPEGIKLVKELQGLSPPKERSSAAAEAESEGLGGFPQE